MDISKKILSDPINKWVFSNAGSETYLVGGYIRDILLSRPAHDKDYVLKGNADRTAAEFAREFSGTFIKLKDELTYRVALKDGELIDFNNFEKEIESDLILRDYTVNAMAWSPETGMIDPAGGISAIEKRELIAVNPDNLEHDPLRVLRAYRIAAELNFAIEPVTRTYLKKYSALLINSAPERITDELYKLLNSENTLKYMKLCGQDGVLNTIFNITQSNIRENLGRIAAFDELTKNTRKFKELDEMISQGLSRRGLIRMSLLLPTDKNSDKSRYFNHLRPSNIIKQKIREIRKADYMNSGRITDNKLYAIYRAAGTSVLEISLIMSSMKKRRRERERLINSANNYLKIIERHLIDGNEIQKILKIKEGAEIGRIQEMIKEGQFKGIFTNTSQARQWILSNFT